MHPKPGAPRLYHDLAWLWPLISPHEDYEEDSEHFAKLISETAGAPVVTLLHLGCGAGHNDHTFLRHFQVVGVDVSEDMLAQARILNPGASYLEGDMRQVRLGRTFSAVIALDATNYMYTEADLRAAFVTAHQHLEPGGIFLTCVEESTERFQQSKTVGSTHTFEGVDITFIQNLYDPNPNDTTYEATFLYLIRQAGKLTIESEASVCGLFPMLTWVKLMLEVGFDVKQFEYQHEGGVLPILVGTKVR